MAQAGPSVQRVDLEAAEAALDRAHTEIGEIAKEGPARRWRMSIPAQPDRDSDLLIANALDAGRLMAAELRELRKDQDNWFAYLRWKAEQDDQHGSP